MKNPIANNRSSALILGAIAFALTFIGAALRVINLYLNFDISIGYYSSSALVDIMNIFFVLSVFALGALSFVMVKKLALETSEPEKDPTGKVIVCFLPIAALAYILAKSYFDVYFAMNSPNKILLHMACLAGMFFFVTLARAALGALKGRSYLFYLTTTVFLSGVYAIPSAIFCMISKIYRDYTYFYFDLFILAVFVFAAVKLIALMTATKPEVEDAPTEANFEPETETETETETEPEATTEE